MNPQVIIQTQAAVAALLADFPELAEDERLRADTLEGETDFHSVLRRLVIEVKAAAGHQTGLSETIKELQARRSAIEAREDRIRGVILSLMNAADLRKLPLPEASLSVSFRAPAPEKPETADGLPDNLVRVKREPDMKAIADFIKAGGELPGIRMSNGKDVLRIG